MPRKKSEVDENLISASSAIGLISNFAGNDYQAKLVIADGLYAGKVTAVAANVWQRTAGGDLSVASWSSLTAAAKKIGSDVEVGPTSWKASFRWPEEVRFWNWETGNFVVCASDENDYQPTRIYLENVRFRRSEVTALVGRTDRSGAGGRKSDRQRWAEFWTRILRKINEQKPGFDWTQFNSERELKAFMHSASNEIFSDNAIDAEVKAVWVDVVLRQAAANRASST